MIGPGLFVAVTLASAHPLPGVPAGAASASPTRHASSGSSDAEARTRDATPAADVPGARPEGADAEASLASGFPALLALLSKPAAPLAEKEPPLAPSEPPAERTAGASPNASAPSAPTTAAPAGVVRSLPTATTAETANTPLPAPEILAGNVEKTPRPAPAILAGNAEKTPRPSPAILAGNAEATPATPRATPTSDEVVDDAPAPQVPQEAPQVAAQVAPAIDPAALRGLAPDFAGRLKRVADRMLAEHGMRMDVIEGWRSQTRQDRLFAQGRTAPGPVVTWTTRSLHTSGRAVDVHIDGAPVTPSNASVLARIAREEGLTTLHPFDSGHVQAVGGWVEGPEGPIERPAPASASAPAPSPRRGVAPPAPIAPVAPVAAPAPAGLVGAAPPLPLPAGDAPVLDDALAARSLEREARASTDARPASTEAVTVDAPYALPRHAPSLAGPTRSGASGAVAAPPSSPDARLVDPTAHELTSPVEVRRLHVPIEGMGQGASLDVRVRGDLVDARLNVLDSALADELRAGLPELRLRLEQVGSRPGDLGVGLVAARDESARPAPDAESRPHARGGEGSSDPERQPSRSGRTFEDPLEQRRDGRARRGPRQEDLE